MILDDAVVTTVHLIDGRKYDTEKKNRVPITVVLIN